MSLHPGANAAAYPCTSDKRSTSEKSNDNLEIIHFARGVSKRADDDDDDDDEFFSLPPSQWRIRDTWAALGRNQERLILLGSSLAFGLSPALQIAFDSLFLGSVCRRWSTRV
jgi:hypothetical protein